MTIRREMFCDSSLWSLLISNIITIIFALTEGWDLMTIMWVYWFQSVTIGLFNFIRLIKLGTLFTAFFFLIHYGMFHFGYFAFLLAGVVNPSEAVFLDTYGFILAMPAGFIFFINHLYSYLHNKDSDAPGYNTENLMFYPYFRIIPMHLTIIFGPMLGLALPIFLILKTFSDCAMHIVEHKVLFKTEEI